MPYCDYKAYTLAAIENFYGSSFVGTFQEMLPGTWLGDTTSLYERIFSLVSLIPQREYDIILLQSEEIKSRNVSWAVVEQLLMHFAGYPKMYKESP